MKQLELESIVEAVSERFWNARTLLTGREDWADVDVWTKYEVKNTAIPFVSYAVPEVFKQFEDHILNTITAGEEMGLDADTILLSIKAEIAERG